MRLPTEFGKTWIYQSYAFARNVRDGRPPILVIIPLRSIVQDQLRSKEFELKAVKLTLQGDVLRNVRDGNVKDFYALAENILNLQFLLIVRELSAVVFQ